MAQLPRVLVGAFTPGSADLVPRANAIYNGLNGNTLLTTPPIPLAVLRAGIDAFSAAQTEALDGGAAAIAQRNALGETLCNMLRTLAHYVEANCNGNVATLVSSGFQTRAKTRTKAPTASESLRKLVAGPNPGQFQVAPVSVFDAASYEVHWAPVVPAGTPATWTTQSIIKSKSLVTLSGFTPGTSYVFEARALTPSGWTGWSGSVTRMSV